MECFTIFGPHNYIRSWLLRYSTARRFIYGFSLVSPSKVEVVSLFNTLKVPFYGKYIGKNRVPRKWHSGTQTSIDNIINS